MSGTLPPPPRKKSKSNDVVSEVGSDSDSIECKNTVLGDCIVIVLYAVQLPV